MKVFILWISSVLLVGSPAAWATIKITSVTGASASDIVSSPPVIFGGTAGSCSTVSETSTCDSCAELTTLSICNKTRIHNSLRLIISFQTDSIDQGTAFLRDSDGNAVSLTYNPTSKSKSEVHVVEVLWSQVCPATGKTTSASCEDLDISGTITIGVKADSTSEGSASEDTLSVSIKVYDPDTGNTGVSDTINECTAATLIDGGICDFQAFPGDEKIYINSLGRSSGFPTTGNVTIKALRFFVGSEDNPGGFVTNPNQGFTKDLEVGTDADGNPETTTRVIEGTNNGVLHFLRVATVDQANNVARFTSNQAIFELCGIDVTAALPDPVPECTFTAKPDEVLGLLEEDLNCFITSVAYGSALDSRVGIFRSFRNKILNKYKWGKKLITYYNTYGPYGAVWLTQNPKFKPVVQWLLWPALGFAWVAGQWGLWTAAIFTILLFTALTFAAHHLQQLVQSRVTHDKE